MPDPNGETPLVEIPAGSLDSHPGIEPDKHIFVDFKAAWFRIEDGLPRLDKLSLRKHRAAQTPLQFMHIGD